jgi:hypothetical protein
MVCPYQRPDAQGREQLQAVNGIIPAESSRSRTMVVSPSVYRIVMVGRNDFRIVLEVNLARLVFIETTENKRIAEWKLQLFPDKLMKLPPGVNVVPSGSLDTVSQHR